MTVAIQDVPASEGRLPELTELFQVLSDKTRLNILRLVSDREWTVSAICRELHLPQPTVSHHLSLLRLNRLVSSRRDGKHVFYSLDGEASRAEGTGLAFRAAGMTVRLVDEGAAQGN